VSTTPHDDAVFARFKREADSANRATWMHWRWTAYFCVWDFLTTRPVGSTFNCRELADWVSANRKSPMAELPRSDYKLRDPRFWRWTLEYHQNQCGTIQRASHGRWLVLESAYDDSKESSDDDPKTTSELQLTAVHEAGHAVAMYALHIECAGVTIVPTAETLGSASNEPWGGSDLDLATHWYRQATVCFAGAEAVHLLFSHDLNAGCRNDARDAAAYLLKAGSDLIATKALQRLARRRAKALVRHLKPEILALAKALERDPTLTGDRVRTIIEDSLDAREAKVPALRF
jgi:Peptidase family M41